MSDGINFDSSCNKIKNKNEALNKFHPILPKDPNCKPLKLKRGLSVSTASDTKKYKSCKVRPKTKNVINPIRCLSDLRNSHNKSGSITYKPLQFIHCHATDNDPLNENVKVAQCIFEPSLEVHGGTTHLVASCGGQYVCIIDCDQGKVLRRFKRENEEFTSLSWSLLELEDHEETTLSHKKTFISVLAAGGKYVRLLFPDYCYYSDVAHDYSKEGDVSSLLFHPSQPHILFVGSVRGIISMWDIGIPCRTRKPNPVISTKSHPRSSNSVLNLFFQSPTPSTYLFTHTKLSVFSVPNGNLNPVLNMVFMDHYSYLIAGCEDGIFSWHIPDTELQSTQPGVSARCNERGADIVLQLKKDTLELDMAAEDMSYDGLAKLNETAIIVKIVNHSQILVVDFAGILEQRRGLSKFNFMHPSGLLHYTKTPVSYIDVSCRPNLSTVLCGSPDGSIWIYDLDSCVIDCHHKNDNQKKERGLGLCEEMFLVLPLLQLDWPSTHQQMNQCVPIINCAEMSHDGRCVVGVTDNNMVCVWIVEQVDNESAVT